MPGHRCQSPGGCIQAGKEARRNEQIQELVQVLVEEEELEELVQEEELGHR